ncbi:MAG TPA: YbhB/YbcL family Raf kinase inhibitor-like protein [Rhabdochlamydiaceae bacterium]|jgi:Raf kinase inhibitor-like YbhB/YbcL family protein|nr:YbhB/YbcL family Raf kinase inhibitor-like protein [Rhabdochlamydiaceae bacterium]
MQLISPAFENGGSIPYVYTCDGKDINPPLEIKGVPAGAKSLVLIMDDPDVPSFVRKDQMWVHWVIYDMPPETRTLKENSTPPGILGTNTDNERRYQGPCPPDREHRYFFKLYALKGVLKLKPGATKAQVEAAMEGQVLEKTELMGRYVRSKK